MTQQSSADNSLLVVGIGASAGGLAVFSKLLHHLPVDTDMAFVLIQHLAPEQKSFLSELLSRTAQIPVQTAEDGVKVQANYVYVIPPNAQMTISQGRLQLAACDQIQQRVKTVDLFLQSLAADRQNKAIAIILSGSNNDGALGVSAVRAAGGITFAQTPATAEFPEMPTAAIATGQVDFILPAAQIAEELVNISRLPYLRESSVDRSEEELSAFQKGDLITIFRLLQKHTGVDFANYKPTTFQRRLRRRMAVHKLSALGEYIQYLQENSLEIQALYQDVLITVTSFFRDVEMYEALKERVFPRLLQHQSATSSIRIWVPGCATGEEAYSIGICLLERLNSLLISPTIQIFGTDISDEAIEEARLGIYRDNRLEGVSPERLRRFFVEVDGGYQINKSVRELCIFARQDLSSDPPFSDIDLVSCRNVLIYFEPPLQRRALSIFHYSLKPTGFLILGNSESIGDMSDLFEVFDAQARVYARRAVPTRLSFDFVTSHYPQEAIAEPRQGFPASLSRSNVQQWADQIVLNRYAPVGVIVNEKLEILQFRGETSPYLRLPLGEPSFNLLKMIRPSLLVDVRAAIETAKEQNVAIKRQRLKMEDAATGDVALEVIPFNVSRAQERCFLVLFERNRMEAPPAPEGDREPEPHTQPATLDVETSRLQQELAATRQELLDTQTFLQLTIEEQETTNQQLIAANEEILSSNEELKSTNEELQTAKEEIQSANEELKTANEELQRRNAESRRANDDLLNLLNNINIPILILSGDLRIQRFTPMMRNLFNLIPSDIGRPIRDIRFEIDAPDLETLVLEVFDTLNTVEREVQDQEGRWYLLRVRPYRTVENQIDGAVVVLVDIDNLKWMEQDLRASQAQLERELLAMNQVQALSRQLFTSFDLNWALNEVLNAAISIHPTTMGCVQLYDPERDVLETVAHRGFDQVFLDHFREVQVNDGSAYGQALTNGQRIIIEDVQLAPEFEPHRQAAAAAGFRAVQSTPLINWHGNLLGALSTYFSQPHSPTDRELRMLDLYGRQASEFIDLIRATEREQQALLEREQAAQAANASKDEFLSVLSHELRTPLTGVLGWVQLMEKGQMEKPELNRAIALIKSSAQAQLKLMEDLLDTSRIVQERFQINPQPTDLADLLQQEIALVQPQAAEKGIHIETDLESCSDGLTVDPDRLAQVFSNLLSNAVKFTSSGGRITVRLTDASSQVQVQVSDTGQGIAADVLPHVFDRFRQADASNTRREGGLGLGLFLVRSIVEAHGGTVQVESLGEGWGTTFTITLPKTIAESIQPIPKTPPAPEGALEGIRVLLVEDSDDTLSIFTFFLEGLGASVSKAQSAAEALAIITKQPLDILISDVGLPDINGYELMRQVRSLPAEQGGQLPAIALTGYVSEQDAQAAIEAGFQLHLAKPVDFQDLEEAMYRLIQG